MSRWLHGAVRVYTGQDQLVGWLVGALPMSLHGMHWRAPPSLCRCDAAMPGFASRYLSRAAAPNHRAVGVPSSQWERLDQPMQF